MAFEELKEKLQTESKAQWEQFQQSNLYIQVKEKYENLDPKMQKVALISSFVLIIYIILSIPMSFYSQSSSYVAEFETKRQLIRDLLKSSREAQESPQMAVPPPSDNLRMRIESQIEAAQLLPEQKAGIEITPASSRIIPSGLSQETLSVALKKLNIKQALDLGHQLQVLNTSVKMTDLVLQANPQDPRYFDVTYKLAVLSVPNQFDSSSEPETPARRGR